jgi:hypothetical protein
MEAHESRLPIPDSRLTTPGPASPELAQFPTARQSARAAAVMMYYDFGMLD